MSGGMGGGEHFGGGGFGGSHFGGGASEAASEPIVSEAAVMAGATGMAAMVSAL
jgi:hypothetical protein